ncbi:hypothetical protein AgCh_004137 [Apium graveolens]
MSDIIEAMELAKNTIRDSFENNASLCKYVINIIEKRWDTQMGVQLYAAGLFLNPGKFFDIQEKDYRNACKLREDFNDVLEKMVLDVETRNLVSNETEHIRENFARQMAIDQRKTTNPWCMSVDWWSAFGGRAPDLALIAKRIVGLCCSSSGCDRNWSTFEFIHTKRRNRLEHKRFNDLVYIQYNEKIAERFQKWRELGEKFDPIALEDFNWSGEWVGNPDGDVVHPGERRSFMGICCYSSCSPRRAFRLLDSESEEEERDDIIPDDNNDEDIEEDYGEIPSSRQIQPGNKNLPHLDDFIQFS